MASNAFPPPMTTGRASEENRSWLDVPSAGTSTSMTGWREPGPFMTESPSGLSATCGDEFLDDLTCLDNSSGLQTPMSPDAFTFAPRFPGLDYELQSERASTSTALPSYESYSHARGRRSFTFSPEVRSRSTPRSFLQVFPAQPRRFASTESLKGPWHIPDAHHTPVSDTGPFLPPGLPLLMSDSGYDPFVSTTSYCWDTWYDDHFDHDQRQPADHTTSSPTRLSPSHDHGDRDSLATSIGSSLSLLGEEGGAGSQSASQQENNYLASSACGLRRLTAYPDDGQSSLGIMIFQEPPGVSTYPADAIIDPGCISAGSGVEVDESSLLATGDRAAPTLDRNDMQRATMPSGRARKFRPCVGSQAMVEACMKRRKRRMDGLNRLFVCEVPGCGRDFTARHNLRYHMKSHNDIRDEICYGCGIGFVTRETLHRHRKRCKKTNRRYP